MLTTKKINLTDLIIFEDNDLLIINKPPGLIVNDATSHSQISLQTLITQYLNLATIIPESEISQNSTPEEIFAARRGMVHRLDKNTSGVLIWGKNPTSLTNLLSQFQNREVEKTYNCLTHGIFNDKDGRIFLPLGRKTGNRQIMAVSIDGREALTYYKVILEYHNFDFVSLKNNLDKSVLIQNPILQTKKLNKLYQGFSYLEVQPKTGRTHQIRAHLTHLQHALVGDQAYLSRNKLKVDPLWCPRQFLHASSITFRHPSNNEIMTFSAVLPQDLQQALVFLS